nr:hypothetical protein [Mycoplasmopsis bovis]
MFNFYKNIIGISKTRVIQNESLTTIYKYLSLIIAQKSKKIL